MATNNGLPMPWTGARTFGRREWDDYRARRTQHLALNPDYDCGFHRPTETTADRIFNLVAEATADRILLENLLPQYKWFREGERTALAPTAKQGLAVALDAAVAAGERSRVLTTNLIADALCSRFSDNYRAALETTDGTVSWNLPEWVMPAALRDLHRNGLLFGELLNIAVGGVDGLYKTEKHFVRVPTKGGETKLLFRGFTVVLTPGRVLDDFLAVMSSDTSYGRPSQGRRVLFAGVTPESDEEDQALSQAEFEGIVVHDEELVPSSSSKVAAGRLYNPSTIGPRSRRVIEILESQRLIVHGPVVTNDVAEWREALESKCVRCADSQSSERHSDDPAHDRLRGLVNAHGPIADQLGSASELVKIRSRFRKWIRYYARDFWPSEVTTKEVRTTQADPNDDEEKLRKDETTHRGRWFHAEEPDGGLRLLAGFDIISSQLQVLAVFLGDRELEALAPRFKEVAAQRARELFELPEGLTEKQLRAAIKTAVMTILYGSTSSRAALHLKDDPQTFGPAGWLTAKMLSRLLRDPNLHLKAILKEFLPACRRVAEIAVDMDPYAGVFIPDPLDAGAGVRLNPIETRRKRVAGNGDYKIFSNLPIVHHEVRVLEGGKRRKKKVTEWAKPSAGDFPVDPRQLRRDIAPNFTHMMDSFFSSLTILKAHAFGVSPIVAIYDCWLTGFGALLRLGQAIWASGEPFFGGLSPMYDFFLGYFEDGEHGDPVRAEWAKRIRKTWDDRKAAEDWPRFEWSPAELVTLYINSSVGEIVAPESYDAAHFNRQAAAQRALATLLAQVIQQRLSKGTQ